MAGLALVAVAALGLVLFYLLRLREFPDLGPLDPRPEVPEFTFAVQRARAVPVGKMPRKKVRRETVDEVREAMDRLYVAGFVDPGQWEDGSFSTFLEQFAGPAAREARRDLPALTVGGAATELSLVTPETGKLRVSVLYSARRRPVVAVALTTFRAVGDLTAGGQTPIEHEGKYILRVVGGRWAVVGYRVAGRIGQPEEPQEAEGGSA